jgi:triacylglycerol lipase
MIAVRGLTRVDYAKYALLVIYAWDMCDIQQNPVSNDLDPRIALDGWTVVGIITGADNVTATAPSVPPQQGVPQQAGGLRKSMVRPGPDIRRYGYLAANFVGDTYVAVIRGTDGAEEWIDDFVFIAEQLPGLPGRVETGFMDIYRSMSYRPLSGGPSVKLSDGIKAAIGGADVLVLGHSLGSTLAEALAFELTNSASLGSARVVRSCTRRRSSATTISRRGSMLKSRTTQ